MKGVTTKNPYKKNLKDWDKKKVMGYLLDKIAVSARGIDFILSSAPVSMPQKKTVMVWLGNDEELQHQYARAREEQAHFMRGENIEIADNVGTVALDDNNDPVLKPDGSPVLVVDAASVAHAKLRIETRRWTMSKLLPKKYGDKVQTEHSGVIASDDLSNLSDEELELRLKLLNQDG